MTRSLVVGATSGIGMEIATRLADHGPVVGAGRSIERAADCPFMTLRCDITAPGDAASLVKEAAAVLGGLDVVVIAAGVTPLRRASRLLEDEVRACIDTNFTGAVTAIASAIGPLRKSAGRLVVLGSSSTAAPWPGLGVYAASKAALSMFCATVRVEEPGIEILEVIIGPTDTSIAEGWDEAEVDALMPMWSRHGLTGASAMTPGQVADAIVDAIFASVAIHRIELRPPFEFLSAAADA